MSQERTGLFPAESGIDELHPLTRITVAVFGRGVEEIEFKPESTTLRIHRGEPYRDVNGLISVDTEMVSLDLHGVSAMLGPIHLRGRSELVRDPGRKINGRIVQMTPNTHFPAENWFDVLLEVETPMGTFENRKPEHMVAHIDRIPPDFDSTPYS